MDLNAIAVFRDVVQHGSFSAAARVTGASPSHVSRQVSALEEALGTRLFQRSTRKVVLTEAGEAYARRVQPLVDELESAREVLDTNAPRGRLRVAAPSAFAHEVMMPWLVQLRAAHPELSIELDLDARLTDLLEERVDVAIRIGRMAPSTLVAVKLTDMRRVVVASPAYLEVHGRPSRPAEVANHECLVFPFEGHRPAWLFRDRKGRTKRVDLQPGLIVPDGQSLRKLTLQGAGLTLLPDWLAARELADGRLVELFSSYDVTATVFEAGVYLVYPSRTYLPSKVRAFIEVARAEIKGWASTD